jgi:hypothetical protein
MRSRPSRCLIGLVLACVGLALVGVASAFAGGWAVTTLDPLPNELRAGQTYAIGYMIRQHGQTPFTSAQTAIEIRSADSQAPQRFRAVPDGPPGHYVAQVTFPAAGEWQWDVDQTPFAPQALGSITVLAPASEPVTETGVSAMAPAWPAPLRVGLPVATALAFAVFAWRLLVYTRSVRAARPSRLPSVTS